MPLTETTSALSDQSKLVFKQRIRKQVSYIRLKEWPSSLTGFIWCLGEVLLAWHTFNIFIQLQQICVC